MTLPRDNLLKIVRHEMPEWMPVIGHVTRTTSRTARAWIRNSRRLSIGLQSDVDAVVGVDDTSTTTISPAMFEACNTDLTDERARRSHATGKFYFHHSCGLIRDLLALYRRTQMDAVGPFYPDRHRFPGPHYGINEVRCRVLQGTRRFTGNRL